MQAGEKLGPYELLAPLGSGGMGEVWKARDTRLERIVAIKRSAERFNARFEREAQAIASLNHPHICTLYDVGPDYLVMELVEGKPLRGPQPLKVALELSSQIAGALHCAHSKGVIHRDLKPGNILVTKAGVKLLDFGLAKMTAPPDAGAETMTLKQSLTKDNAILGTLQYMSPEQLEGRPADERSDIFAFGLVLYELICGRPAFEGRSRASLIAAILKEEPRPMQPLQPLTPPALDRLVRMCLAKDPDSRWQCAADLRNELVWIAQQSGEVEAAPGGPVKRRAGRIPAAAAVIVLLAMAYTAGRLISPAPAANWTGQRLGGPEIAFGPRVSPGGHTLAFQAMAGQNTQVAVMKPESGNWQVLTHKSDSGSVTEITWSPDGNKLYYDRFADVPAGVYSVPALGGDEHLELEDAFSPEALADGSLLVVKLNRERRFQVFRFWPDSGRLEGLPVELGSSSGVVSVIDKALLRASRDGKQAFAVGRKPDDLDRALHLYRIDLASREVRRVPTGLPNDSAISGLAPGVERDSLLASVESSDLVRIVALANGAGPRTLVTVTGDLKRFDMGPDGVLYADLSEPVGELLRFAPSGGQAEKIGFLPPCEYGHMALLPDGRLAFFATFGDRSRLMVAEPGKDPLPLVRAGEEVSPPLASMGAREVAFVTESGSGRSIAVASTVNGRISRRIPFDNGPISSLAASPDGRTIYCAAAGTIWAISRSGDARKIGAGDHIAVEPGGRSLLVKVLEAPRARLLRVPLDGSSPREIVLAGSLRPSWTVLPGGAIGADGRMIAPMISLDSWFLVPGIVDLATGKAARIPVDYTGDYFFLAWTPDGRILAAANQIRGSLWQFRPEGR